MAKQQQFKQTEPLKAEIRTQRGSRKSQYSRAHGQLPAVVYGHGQPSAALLVPLVETEKLIHSGVHVIDIAIDGKVEKVLIQDVQYNYLQTKMEHVDFLRVDPNQRVKVKVPLDFRGTPKGTKEGGILETQLTELEIEAPVTAIPDVIRANVENLGLHEILHAKDIPLPENTKLITWADGIVCQVRTVKEEVAPTEAAATPAEPEVIGKKKEEEGAEGEAGKAAPAAKAPAKK